MLKELITEEHYRCTQHVEVTPEVDIEAVLPAHVRVLGCKAQRIGHTITHYSVKYAYNMIVRDSTLGVPLIVATDYIVMLTYPQHAVQDILTVIALVEWYVQALETSLWLGLDYQQVTVLAQQRHHTIACVCVNQYTLLVEYFLKGGFLAHFSIINPSTPLRSAGQ